MPDFDVIGTALAAAYGPGQMTPPAGLEDVRGSSASLPNALNGTSQVLVFPDSGTFASGGGSRLGLHVFFVRFYLRVTKDLNRETNECRKWLTVLTGRLRTAVQLGGTTSVVAARVVGWRIGSMRYGRITYTGVELRVEVETAEGWLASS